MDPKSVTVNPGKGRAVFEATNLDMPDYRDFVNSVIGGPSVPGVVTFRMEWEPSHDKHRYHDAVDKWEGNFVQTQVQCSWSGRTSEAEFHTDTLNPTIFAEVGHEKNGVFFH